MTYTPPRLALHAVAHTYPGRPVLSFPAATILAGESAALLGPSGSGKTTLLLLIAGLLSLQQGSIAVDGASPSALAGAARDRWRGHTIGVVLQSFRLLAKLSVIENLTIAQYFAGHSVDVAAARHTLDALDILPLADERPGKLSRGQLQRAAIARAVVNRPKVILADEPTSSLDDVSADASLSLLLGEAKKCGAALLIATHDRRVRAQVTQQIEIAPCAHA